MTWLDKFKADHPTLSDEYIIDEYCPDDGLVSNCPLFDGEPDCEKCWRRPAPEKPGGITQDGPDRAVAFGNS